MTAHCKYGHLIVNILKNLKNMSVKLKIRELRIAHPEKPSQRKMGDILGMTESNYRKLETNKLDGVKLSHLDTLIKFFQCEDISEIIDIVPD
jgi:DNA-binding Xre family transcriptional regulator